MNVQRIEFPKHLLEHNISKEVLAAIPVDKQGMAIEWNMIRRQNDWLIERAVDNRNMIVELSDEQNVLHKAINEQLEFWGRIRWLMASICGVALTIVTILKQMGYFK